MPEPTQKRSERHRSFPVAEPLPLKHTDQCLADVRRYGFCEHEELPLPRQRPRWRQRHPHWTEAIAIGTFGALMGSYVLVVKQMGWWGLVVYSVSGIFWLGVLIWGLPKALTTDPREWIPADAKQKLWD